SGLACPTLCIISRDVPPHSRRGRSPWSRGGRRGPFFRAWLFPPAGGSVRRKAGGPPPPHLRWAAPPPPASPAPPPRRAAPPPPPASQALRLCRLVAGTRPARRPLET